MKNSINPALEGSPVVGYLKFAIPSVIALLAMSAAPIIDGLFIANYLGVEALAAVNLIIPVFVVVFGVAYMIAIGGSVTAGKFIGENNKQAASDIFSKTIIVGIIYSLIMVGGGVLGSERLFALLGAGPDLFPLMHEYFGIFLWFLPAHLVGVVLYYYVRISGFPTLVSVAIVVGVLMNLALNYLLIGLLGFGLKGAAIATGISSLVMVGIMLTYRLHTDGWLKFTLSQSNWKIMLRAAYNGFSDFLDEISAGVVTFVLNLIVIKTWGSGGVAAFSVASYSLFIGFLFFFGLSEALQAVSSQCFGARNVERMQQFLKITTILVVIFGILFSILLLSFGDIFIGFFIDSNETDLINLSKGFIAILWPIFIFNGLNVMIAAYLTAIHRPSPSAVVAVLRALVFPLGLLYLIVEFFPEIPFLAAITAGEMLTLFIAIFLFMNYRPSRVIANPVRDL